MAVRLPGAYTTSTLHLRSFVRIFIETEATIFSSKDVSTYDEKALLYGEDLEHITIEGPGVINGQAEYEWGLSDHDDRYIIGNPRRMEALGKPLMRSFPTENSIGNLCCSNAVKMCGSKMSRLSIRRPGPLFRRTPARS